MNVVRNVRIRNLSGKYSSVKYTIRNKKTLKNLLGLKWCIF